jgi:hypothetical protein
MKLHQVVALAKIKKSHFEKSITEVYHVLQKSALFDGLFRQYRPKADDGEVLPPEGKVVQNNVADQLDLVRKYCEDTWETIIQHEATNIHAKGTIVCGNLSIADVPVAVLIWLEKRFVSIKTLLEALPTLDTGEEWVLDEQTRQYKSRVAQTHRTTKNQEPIVLYDATKEHPAQTQLITKDTVVGYWSTTKLSGAIPAERKRMLLDRLRRLNEAVILARQEANKYEVVAPLNITSPIFDFLLKE